MFCFKKQGSRAGTHPKDGWGVKGHGFRKIFLVYILFFFLAPIVYAQDGRLFLTDEDQFNYASFLLKQEHYSAAAREFGRVIEEFPSSRYIPDSQYMTAESYLKEGRYRDAVREFTQFTVNFPDNKFAADAVVKKEMLDVKIKESLGFPAPLKGINHETKDFKIKAAQILLFKEDSYEDVEKEIVRLKEGGINTIIVRVFHNRGDRFHPFVTPRVRAGVYFNTKHAPVVEDMLGNIIKMAHRHNLKIFAWMTTRYADYGIEDKTDLRCKAYDLAKNMVVQCKGLDLFNDEAVSHLEKIYKDLARYDIDGILFQDDLYLRHTEGFGQYANALYLMGTGNTLKPSLFYSGIYRNNSSYIVRHYTPAFWEWASWKNKRLLTVAKRLMKTVRDVNPKVVFTINLMYESVSNPAYALAWLSQSLDDAVGTGFDYYAIMAYHLQMQDELKKGQYYVERLIERMTKEAVERVGSPSRVIMKVQTVDWSTRKPLPDREVSELLKKISFVDNVSLAVVPYRIDFPFEIMNQFKD
ncbi:MAG TPA: hypothetical protein DD641_09435 [Deltaproteobacteria bacterium]|nr:hypothetical protein [Deltaproteobacteria bacterium]